MSSGTWKPRILFIVNTSSQAELLDAIRNELLDCDSLAVTTDWQDKEARNALESLAFPYKSIESYSKSRPKDIIGQERPNMLIVGHDILPINQLFIKAANSKGIPTLLVQDGILAAEREAGTVKNTYSRLNFLVTFPLRLSRFLRLLKSRKFTFLQILRILRLELRYNPKGKIISTYGHGECSKIAVFGNAVKEVLPSEGIDPERIVVTGNPKSDKLFHHRNINSKQSVCKRWGIPQENEIIVLLNQPFIGVKALKQRNKFITAIIDAVSQFQNISLIIKLHPGENENTYQKIVKEIGYPAIISKDADLAELLSASSLVITISSTAALEAMALGKRVVIVNLFNDPSTSFYKESGVLYAYTEKDISLSIMKVLSDPQTREGMRTSMERFVYEQAYLQDGKASKRIAQLIKSMISESEPTHQTQLQGAPGNEE